MSLVVLCGEPSSGKTRRANELHEYICKNYPDMKSIIVSDVGINRDDVYGSSRSEITTRGAIKSAAERELNSKTIVIVDSLNYIKGFRYELHCVSKYARTTYCVIYCIATKEDVSTFNSLKNEDERYSKDILEALMMRFEPPNSMNRWDSPLFTVQPADSIPAADICKAIFEKSAQKPNMSTQNPPLMSPTFVYETDKLLQKVGATILAAQKTSSLGETVALSDTSETYTIQKIITMPEMRRHRKQFLAYLRSNPVSDVSKITKSFLFFINQSVG